MTITILQGDVRERLRGLADESVHCVVTSPPYWGLRDYGVAGQIGLEATPELFVAEMAAVFEEARRVLRDDGTLWLNLGDSYAGSGRGGNPTKGSSTLEGGHASQEASMVRRSRGLVAPIGLKPKDLMGMPWRVAFALQAAGWYLRQDIVWSKPNPMPESVNDRCTKAHEFIFLLSKNGGKPLLYQAKDTREWHRAPDLTEMLDEDTPRWRGFDYYFDQDAILEDCSPNTHARLAQNVQDQIGSDRANGGTRAARPVKAVARKTSKPGSGIKNNDSFDAAMAIMPTKRNKRSVWTVTTKGFKGAHFATFPPKLIEPCILAGCPAGGTVLDPFFGAGTTGLVAEQHGRNCIGIELNPEYVEIATRRLGLGIYG